MTGLSLPAPPGLHEGIAVRRRHLPEGAGLPRSEGGPGVRTTAEEVMIHFPGVGTFRVAEGTTIEVDPAPGAGEELLRLWIQGPALAHLLEQRGFAVLHGSAVGIGGTAAAFLGRSGAGKSTLAGALGRRGHGLLSDDLAPISDGDSGPVLLPGPRGLKLREDSLRWLGLEESSVSLGPGLGKRGIDRGGAAPGGPVPLGAIYILAPGEEPSLRKLPPQAALVALIRESYCARLLRTVVLPHHFRILARAVRSVPVKSLGVPRAFEALPLAASLVEEDLRGH